MKPAPVVRAKALSDRLRWVLGAESAEQHAVQDARLIVTAAPGANWIDLHLIPFPSARVWFDTTGVRLHPADSLTWRGAIQADTSFLVHFAVADESSVKLLASLGITPMHTQTAFVNSPAITVREKQWLSAESTSFLGAFLAFFLGFFAHVLQKRYDDWQETKKQEGVVFRSLLKEFNGELINHRFLLSSFLDNPALDLPAILHMAGRNALLKEGKYIDRFLASMHSDNVQISAYYEAVNQLNTRIRAAQEERGKAHRQVIIPDVERLLASLDALPDSVKP